MSDQLARHREAARTARRTTRILTWGGYALLGVAVLFALAENWIGFGGLVVLSLLVGELSDRAHRDYRAAVVRADRIERMQRRIPSQRDGSPEFVPCCGTWVASAGLAHERRCPYGEDAAA